MSGQLPPRAGASTGLRAGSGSGDQSRSAGYSTSPHYLHVGASRGCAARLYYELHSPRPAAPEEGRPRPTNVAKKQVLLVMGLLTDGTEWWPQVWLQLPGAAGTSGPPVAHRAPRLHMAAHGLPIVANRPRPQSVYHSGPHGA